MDKIAKGRSIFYENLYKFPIGVGQDIFIVGKCKDFPARLDGSWENATGYYCPYTDSDLCPFKDISDCSDVLNKYGVFEDRLLAIHIEEDETSLIFENCIGKKLEEYGKTIFSNKEKATKEAERRNKC